MRGAIYLLSHAARIDSLVAAIRSIHTHFNVRHRYPVIVFTEGDFTQEHVLRVHEAAGVEGAAASFANGTLTTATLAKRSTVSFYRVELEVRGAPPPPLLTPSRLPLVTAPLS